MGFVPDPKPLLAGSFKEHGWDPENGLPSTTALQKYGLEFKKKLIYYENLAGPK